MLCVIYFEVVLQIHTHTKWYKYGKILTVESTWPVFRVLILSLFFSVCLKFSISFFN